MNKEQAIAGVCVGAGLIGLGLLVYSLYNEGSKLTGANEQTVQDRTQPTLSQLPSPRLVYTKKSSPVPEKKPAEQPKANKVEKKKQSEEQITKQPAPLADEFPLRLGSQGKRVERLNVYLMRNYGWTGVITSNFDQKTLGQIKRFLKVDQITEEQYNRLKLDAPVHQQHSA